MERVLSFGADVNEEVAGGLTALDHAIDDAQLFSYCSSTVLMSIIKTPREIRCYMKRPCAITI